MNQKKAKLVRKFSSIKGLGKRGYRQAKKFYKSLTHQEKGQASADFIRVVTAKLVWDFVNGYYRQYKTTPGLGVIRSELKMLGSTGENKLRRAIKTLEREGYIRLSMEGNHKFIVLIRTGEYR